MRQLPQNIIDLAVAEASWGARYWNISNFINPDHDSYLNIDRLLVWIYTTQWFTFRSDIQLEQRKTTPNRNKIYKKYPQRIACDDYSLLNDIII